MRNPYSKFKISTPKMLATLTIRNDIYSVFPSEVKLNGNRSASFDLTKRKQQRRRGGRGRGRKKKGREEGNELKM